LPAHSLLLPLLLQPCLRRAPLLLPLLLLLLSAQHTAVLLPH
jgi:hypothetical protein